MPKAQRGGIGPQVALLLGVEDPQGHVEPVVMAQAGEIEKAQMRPRQRRLAVQYLFETSKGGGATTAMCTFPGLPS